MLIKASIGAVITAAIVGTTLQIALPPRPKILYNPSSSAPIGWYQLTDNYAPKRNDLVAAYAPDWARKLADERSYLPYGVEYLGNGRVPKRRRSVGFEG